MMYVIRCTLLCACAAMGANAQVIHEDARFEPDPGITDYMGYGGTIAINGNCVLIGAPRESLLAPDAGAVYVFDLNSGEMIRKITHPDPSVNDQFGRAIDVDGDLAIIGMTREAALVNINTGQMLHEFTETTPGVSGEYGASVGIENNRIVIGDRFWDFNVGSHEGMGSAFVYNAETYELNGQLHPVGATDGYHIATSIDILGDYALFGTPGLLLVNGPIPTQGGAFLYNLRTRRFLSAYRDIEPDTRQYAGADVVLTEDRVFIGAPGTSVSPWDSPGSVLIFDRESRELLHELKQADSNENVQFGAAIACHGDFLAVGAPYLSSNGVFRSGNVYVYNHRSGDLLYTLESTTIGQNQFLGFALDIDSTRILSSVPGSVLSFPLPGTCHADRNGDGALNFHDVSDFIADYLNQDPSADLSHDGAFNAFDVLAFIALFNEGCP
ncbi:MAG: FG-GAP repeat protein [bacterium]|nr:FG-GAP repeat protein [bacterium]